MPPQSKTSPVSNGGKVSEQGKSKPGSSQSVTPPPSGKFPRTKPTTDKQRIEDDSVAKERLRVLRTTPNEFGLTFDDYSELLGCPLPELSNVCAKIFQYQNTGNNYKNVMLDHLHVRAVYELREIVQDEDTMQILVNLLLSLLEKLKEPELGHGIVVLMGEFFHALLHPKQVLTIQQIMQVMDNFKETFVYQHRLIRHALTFESQPFFITAQLTVDLPSEQLSSKTTPLPLAEAIPKKMKRAATVETSVGHGLPASAGDVPPVEQETAHTSAKDSEPQQELPSNKLPELHATDVVMEEEVMLAVQKVVASKFNAFKMEVENAVKTRERLFSDKTNNIYASKM
ncbi:uncharacterized protein LOC129586690 [Paramacrobiotus metropolitanus]|uniref:uncharacterized protein LOC129586690 n=1 Tax=Paramacrobiotus metropolitanus TaxID=2943436 RepID=UPI002445DA3A|nr:uncharacterized protein LOC129586690 [Paramacrobiotus metropolitanus]